MATFDNPEEHFIDDWYLSVLFNGDYSSFDYYSANTVQRDEAIREFDNWVTRAEDGRQGHWSCPDADATYFVICEVGGRHASCAEVKFHPIRSNA